MPLVKIECSMRKGANILFRIGTKWRKIWNSPIRNYRDFPIIINNYNRLQYLQLQITWLEKAGYRNIFIIDNHSSYPPLLDYYSKLPYTVFILDRNKGHFSLWETVIFSRFSNDYYVYTDPDILPVTECPDDILEYFKNLLDKFPGYKKVGLGLKIDDLPEHYALKNEVIQWEDKFWRRPLQENIFDALIDTTFALYRSGAKGGADGPAIRTGGNYIARHLPWYEDSANPCNETKYYLDSASTSSSWYAAAKGENKQYFE